jgi:integrase
MVISMLMFDNGLRGKVDGKTNGLLPRATNCSRSIATAGALSDRIDPIAEKRADKVVIAAASYADVPAFLKDAPGTAAKALAFAILTAARTSEVVGMTFTEIDGLDSDKPTWIAPKERMKMGREHRVPLTASSSSVFSLPSSSTKEIASLLVMAAGLRPSSSISRPFRLSWRAA